MCITMSRMSIPKCDDCIHLAYDDELDEEYCEMELDEDELGRLLRGDDAACPFYRGGNSDYFLSGRQ